MPASTWARRCPQGQNGTNLNNNKARPAPPNAFQGRGPTMAISLKVNGASRSTPAEPDTPLLYVLRNDLVLNGAKFGCGLAQCGACTVLVDGKADALLRHPDRRARQRRDHHHRGARHGRKAASAAEGLHRRAGRAVRLLHQRHDHDGQGAARPASRSATEADVREALAGNLCRCGTHNRIVAAVLRAGKQMGRT